MPTSYEQINGTPDHRYTIGRCYGPAGRPGNLQGGHGLAWLPKTGASINRVKCPIHDTKIHQTTRSWQVGVWTVIPESIIAGISKAYRDEQNAKKAGALSSGTHTLVKDLQPGQLFIFEKSFKNNEVASGKLVEIEKTTGGKYKLTVSREYDQVVAKYDHWSARGLEDGSDEQAEKLESLTVSGEVPGSLSVCTNIEWAATNGHYRGRYLAKRWLEGTAEDDGRTEDGVRKIKMVPFAGWAVDQPQCQLELWYLRRDNNEELLRRLGDDAHKLIAKGVHESEERFQQRKLDHATRLESTRAMYQKRIDQAYRRIELHTNHGRP